MGLLLLASARGSLSICALSALLAAACSIDTDNLFTGGAGGTGAGPSAGGNDPNGGNAQGASSQGAGSQGGDGAGGNTTTLSGAECGDGTKNGNEQCDGSDLGGVDCVRLGFDEPGGLACNGSCTYDTSKCVSATGCGNNVHEDGEECDDGNAAPNDGCSQACDIDGSCATAIAYDMNPGPLTIVGSTVNGGSVEDTANTLSYCNGSTGPEIVFLITPQSDGIFTAYLPSSGTPFDAVLYKKATCDTTEGICHDNYGTPGNAGGDILSFGVQDQESFYLFVDGYNPPANGAFQLELDLSSGDTCGDAVPIVVEGSASIQAFGDTSGLASNGASVGGLCSLSGAGPDIIYDITPAESAKYTFETFASFNSVLHAREDCDDEDTQITCSAPVGQNGASMEFDMDEGVSASVWVDGSSGQAGTYTLQITHP